jgi:hypothetical protein
MKRPSVTNLTGMLDKPALMKWANRIGLEGVSLDEYRLKSTSHGKQLHKAIEDYLIHGKDFENYLFGDRFKSFMSDKELIGVEQSVGNEHFMGRYDIKLKHNGVVYICDFKSNHKRVYFENILQLAAYRMADGCDKIAVISIPDLNVFPIEIEDFTPYERVLVNLSEIYKIQKSL